MVSYTSASFIVNILAAVILLLAGSSIRAETDKSLGMIIYKTFLIALSFALGLVAFKVI